MPEQDDTEVPSYYDLQAIEQRQQDLMLKRHSPEGLREEEVAELLDVNLQALDMRTRWDRQR